MLYFSPGHDRDPVAVFGPDTGETTYVQTTPNLPERINAITQEIAQSRIHGFKSWAQHQLVDTAAKDRDGRLLAKDLGVRAFVTSPAACEVLSTIALREARAARIYTRR